jgi:hypothetical protein
MSQNPTAATRQNARAKPKSAWIGRPVAGDTEDEAKETEMTPRFSYPAIPMAALAEHRTARETRELAAALNEAARRASSRWQEEAASRSLFLEQQARQIKAHGPIRRGARRNSGARTSAPSRPQPARFDRGLLRSTRRRARRSCTVSAPASTTEPTKARPPQLTVGVLQLA